MSSTRFVKKALKKNQRRSRPSRFKPRHTATLDRLTQLHSELSYSVTEAQEQLNCAEEALAQLEDLMEDLEVELL